MVSPPALPASQRIALLDVVRGVALLGILIMNMPGFSQSFFAGADGTPVWPGAFDQVAEAVRDALFSGKFNSMFSLLFGLGFTLQYARMQARDPQRATLTYVRRLAALLVLGLVHGMLFWTGDVLHLYALLGFVLLLPLRRAGPRVLVGAMALCVVYPVIAGLVRSAVMTPDIVQRRTALARAWEASNNAYYGHGTFAQATLEHVREFVFYYADPWALWFGFGGYVQFAFTLLLGVLVGRTGWLQRIPELMPTIRRLMWWALAIGLATGIAFSTIFALNRSPGPSLVKLIGGWCYWISRPAMMAFYVLLIVRLMQRPAWQRRFAPIALAGRMPLTNYLMQTAICTPLFYGWGFGLWNRVGPAAGIVLAVAIFFVIQVPWSRWWLARHDKGPLEAAWAWATYGRGASAPPRTTAGVP